MVPPVTVTPPDEVDAHSVGALDEALRAVADGTIVHVDCSSVTFMDSSGLRALIAAHNRLSSSGGGVRVVRPTPFVRRLLDVAGLESFLAEGP